MKLMPLRTLAALALVTSALGQVTISSVNTPYTQNFNTLVSTGTGTWADNTTLLGWYARTTATASISSYAVNSGAIGTTFGLYSIGTTSASDRALGFVSTNTATGAASTGQNFLGLRVTNATGATATSFTLAYDGEQWRKENNASSQSLVVQYAFNASGLTDNGVTWTTISALAFTSPITGATAATVLDGNLTANRLSLTTTETATWLNGADLWIRWADLNDSGNDHLLAVDNVSLTAIAASPVPEPSTYAALAGALALVGVIVHRRRRAA